VAPLLSLGREEGVTFFMTMLAAFTALLYRISGEHDIVLGSPIANRNDLQLQPLIGFFTNTIALRTRLDGNPSFREVMRRARVTALGAYAHQDLPFEKVVEALRPKRDPSYNPLFQVNFRAQASERPALRLAGIRAQPIAVDIGFSRFDLALEVELGEHELTGYFEYDRDLFDADSISALIEDLGALLAEIGAQPDAPILALKRPREQRTARQRTAGRTIARRPSK
jgi:non-ribosomal peptide synthetase component F